MDIILLVSCICIVLGIVLGIAVRYVSQYHGAFVIQYKILIEYKGNAAKVVIPDHVTSIGKYAFWGCTGLGSIEIPDGVTSIGNSAFLGCTGLTRIDIRNSVKSIGNCAFKGCISLTEVEIPNSVKSIGYEAFKWCTRLTEVEIPEGCVLGIDVFKGCNALETIFISESDIERLSAPGIFPKPLDQYKIIIKKRSAAVEQLTSEAKYKQLACQVYDSTSREGIRPVVRFIVPVGYYLIDKLPSDIRRVLQNVEDVFSSKEFLNSKYYLPIELQERILRSLVAISGKSVCKTIDFQAQSDDGADLKGKMSKHYTIY